MAKSSGSRRKAKSAKAEKHADSRVQLIDATLETILRDGADAQRIEDVCEHVGVTKGSLYWHFRDRNGLIRESLLEHMRRLGAAQLDALSDAIGNFSTVTSIWGNLVGQSSTPMTPKK
ncbi:MAG: TetR/AcrR family transcriptional regulator [Actinomycetota bacterium]